MRFDAKISDEFKDFRRKYGIADRHQLGILNGGSRLGCGRNLHHLNIAFTKYYSYFLTTTDLQK